jgi:hypothetical protein
MHAHAVACLLRQSTSPPSCCEFALLTQRQLIWDVFRRSQPRIMSKEQEGGAPASRSGSPGQRASGPTSPTEHFYRNLSTSPQDWRRSPGHNAILPLAFNMCRGSTSSSLSFASAASALTVWVHAHMCTRTHTHARMHARTYAHTHSHTHTHY